jgi:hypothetical protein
MYDEWKANARRRYREQRMRTDPAYAARVAERERRAAEARKPKEPTQPPTISCHRCGVAVAARTANYRYCRDCRAIRDRECTRQWMREWRERVRSDPDSERVFRERKRAWRRSEKARIKDDPVRLAKHRTTARNTFRAKSELMKASQIAHAVRMIDSSSGDIARRLAEADAAKRPKRYRERTCLDCGVVFGCLGEAKRCVKCRKGWNRQRGLEWHRTNWRRYSAEDRYRRYLYRYGGNGRGFAMCRRILFLAVHAACSGAA